MNSLHKRSIMQKSVEKRVFEYCEKHHMLKPGEGVVLGVSGGADSVCLLLIMLQLQKIWDLKLHVVHINHGIRKDAKKDAAFVEELCGQQGVPYYLYQEDIPSLAKTWSCSGEEAGRRVRYQAFEEVRASQGCKKIAVAHNSNDRAETMLFHLFRGTGLAGLTGIRPKRDFVIRPLLCLSRKEIEGYLQEKGIAYCHDITNDGDEYTRNKIRHHILPYAEQEIVQGSIANMVRTADILEETENYIEEQMQKVKETCVKELFQEGPAYELDLSVFLGLHTFMKKRVILHLLQELSPAHKDIAAIHVEDVCRMCGREGNAGIYLPYGIRARKEYGKLFLERPKETPKKKEFQQIEISAKDISSEESVFCLGNGRRIYMKLLYPEKNCINFQDIPQNKYTKWFDYDKIIGCIVLRTRRVGDYFTMKGPKDLQRKKVKDYMIAEKIPKGRREEIPLLAQGEHVLWLVGYRISEYYKVEETTKTILQVRFEQNSHITER